MVDTYDRKRDRWQRKFKYPLYVRLLFIVPLLLVGGLILFFTLDAVDNIDLLKRARDYLDLHDKARYAVLGVVGLISVWLLYISLRSWMAYIIVSPSSIKHHIVAHGRLRISWEHTTEIEYRRRLFGHSLVLHGSDGGMVSFRSSIKKYDDLIALIHKNAPNDVQAQLEELLADEDEEEWEDDEEEDLGEDEEPENEDDDEPEKEQEEGTDETIE